MSNGQLITAIVSLISAMGVVASMVFIGWQMRQSTHQRRVANAIAGTSSLRATLEHLHTVQRIFIDQPQLFPYFNDSKKCPSSGDIRHQVMTMAEMLADVLEVGLTTNEKISSTDSADDWLDYSTHMLAASPTIAALVLDHPVWWPRLATLSRLHGSAEADSSGERSPAATAIAARNGAPAA